ncbi:unnamed protein product [Acanthoscelides obtectus]|uniref:NADP-dependent oxidoreductase domain-containing protein n=4 Tax=Acanthoscelides obtectus TaxID=200917 RepID=A0A9P0LX47_ACAOB|nr:unnamed protein product [Acanthoscelides obtectus]CAH2003368.1 unnamed protein product [Acanthoscelides obtectus]CAK1651251.1 Alcohol dehydrogenase [NADP(+)] [Acanthoscelides obtectus]CAK1651253.1 Alcohol dehydrogenase [NADP(+)] [Acanthoscelides obtectus]
MKFLNVVGGGKMPIIGLGTWQATNDEELTSALNHALEAGYRHIDTAYVYDNEKIIGKVLKEWISSGRLKREDLFITTKLPICGIHEDRVEMFMKMSLENLQLDYVDLYLIHFPIGTNYIEGYSRTPNDKAVLEKSDHIAIWKKMEEQVDAGRTKAIGLSNFNKRQVEKVLKNARIKPASLQVELHVLLQQKELVEFCQSNGIVVVAYSPLGSPGFNNFMQKHGFPTREMPNILQQPAVQKIADKHKKATGQILLRFWIEQNVVVIPKSTNPERLKQNMGALSFSLDSDDIEQLKALDMGEEGRIFNMDFLKGMKDHPEYPFVK